MRDEQSKRAENERNNLHGGQNLLKNKQKLYEALNLNPKYLTTTEGITNLAREQSSAQVA